MLQTTREGSKDVVVGKKIVKLYRPVIIHPDGSREDPNYNFWADVHRQISGLPQSGRAVNYHGASYFGEAGTGLARAYPYIRVGRVRYRADWPETIDPAGNLGELNLQGRDIFEGGYIVPFGTETRVAVMGPIRGLVTVKAIEWWLVQVLGLPTSGLSLELIPEIDPTLARKLNQADGVSRLSVRIPKGTVMNLDPNSEVEAAFAMAHDASDDELHVDMTFSFGHERPRGDKPGVLKRAAMKLAESGAEKVDVSLILPKEDGEGYRVEHHELIRDKMTITVDFHVEDDTRLSTEEVLEAIHDAIQVFRQG